MQQIMAAGFEIEIKSLLGSKENASALKERFFASFPHAKLTSKNNQLNHYFEGGDLVKLREKFRDRIPADHKEAFENILRVGKKHSVRTRQLDATVILVIKASIDDTTSSNGISRMECEVAFPDLTLDELDQLLLEADFTYQAKWSREREQYEADDFTVCIDKNAGYGYLAEFEKVVGDAAEAEATRDALRGVMGKLGVAELPQERLERMFAFYNAHWPEYYGTEKVFTIE
jgi:predicted adenylyl cyclase CyaB